MIIPVILAGGAGTRLWPMSTEDKPKQFHNMSGGGTLLEETIKRIKPLSPEEIIIVSSGKYEELSLSEIKKTGLNGTILSEPAAKNTAAAVLYAAFFLKKKYGDPVMAVLPADHFIKDTKSFVSVISKAIPLADKDYLSTIGIKPEYPETGYGYIKGTELVDGALKVDKITEKPPLKIAQQYIKEGNFYWNSGIFVWKTSVIIEWFKKLLPDMYKQFLNLETLSHEEIASNDKRIWDIKSKIYSSIKSISIDKGILENSDNRMVIPAEFGWADLGSWKSVDDILKPDSSENRTQSPGNSIFVKSNNCTILSEGMTIALVGVSNITVVQSGNDILVIDKDSSQDVRDVVDIIKNKK
ncbi:MAG: sugar phosphate nucleotidyltransferase [Spirochaetes bacterium]|nr:sugar phosphate nucleotidyltransferase [Spirochaetota bacterium]